MTVRRVFLLWRHPLFYESMRLLLDHPSVTLVGATSDHAGSMDRIRALKPDVVIFEEAAQGEQNEIDPLSLLLQETRVICLGMSDNELSVLNHRQRTVAKSDELLTFILENLGEAQE